MNFEIKGGEFPVLIVNLDKNEEILSESGAMSWMSSGMIFDTTTGGGLLKGLQRSFSGESMFINNYKAGSDNQFIAFASSFAGRILDIKLDGGKNIIAQKDAFLAMEKTVEMSVSFRKKLSVGFFGGEGFILQKFSGSGHVFLEIDGAIMEYNLKQGEKLIIDQGHLAAMESTVNFEIEMVKGIKNVLFGGEGLFIGTLTGPGKVWLQTMPVSNLANKIIAHMPRSSN